MPSASLPRTQAYTAAPNTPDSELIVPGAFGVGNNPLAAGTGRVLGASNSIFLEQSIAGGAITVYDSLGNEMNVQLRWAKTDSAATGGDADGPLARTDSGERTRPAPRSDTRVATRAPDGVAALQRALGVPADADFGPATEKTLKRWQRAPGLPADGVAGPRTRDALGLGSGEVLRRQRAERRARRHATRPVRARLVSRGGGVAARALPGREIGVDGGADDRMDERERARPRQDLDGGETHQRSRLPRPPSGARCSPTRTVRRHGRDLTAARIAPAGGGS